LIGLPPLPKKNEPNAPSVDVSPPPKSNIDKKKGKI